MARGKPKRVGSLWTHKDKNGTPFFSGVIELKDRDGNPNVPEGATKISIMIFKNTFREKGTKQPNWYINIPVEEEDEATESGEEEVPF